MMITLRVQNIDTKDMLVPPEECIFCEVQRPEAVGPGPGEEAQRPACRRGDRHHGTAVESFPRLVFGSIFCRLLRLKHGFNALDELSKNGTRCERDKVNTGVE